MKKMARTLDELRAQYNSVAQDKKGFGMGPGPRGARMSGKPKNVKATVKRLLSYVGEYKFRLIAVLVCMLLTTLTSLFASYLIAPIINRITLEVNPLAEISESPLEMVADKVIEAFVSTPLVSWFMGSTVANITVYVFGALLILAFIYVISAVSSYVQARLMLSVSQNSVKKIRNELFEKLQELPVR